MSNSSPQRTSMGTQTGERRKVCELVARAKVNLALRIHGKRPDGYHEIETLIAFVEHGDRIRVSTVDTPGWPALDRSGSDPAAPQDRSSTAIKVSGPFASAIDSENLIDAARRLLAQDAPALAPIMAALQIDLEKHVPVAAGLGGGSADAAAFLRAVQQLFPIEASNVDWLGVASRLGADVPACFKEQTVIARGTGTDLAETSGLPSLPIVLVNTKAPPVPRKTPRVFGALAASACPTLVPKALRPAHAVGQTQHREAEWFRWLHAQNNDLERPCATLMPEVAQVLDLLRAHGAPIARLSGAGPTCFALFPHDRADEAERLAQSLAALQPKWWICRSVIGDGTMAASAAPASDQRDPR